MNVFIDHFQAKQAADLLTCLPQQADEGPRVSWKFDGTTIRFGWFCFDVRWHHYKVWLGLSTGGGGGGGRRDGGGAGLLSKILKPLEPDGVGEQNYKVGSH